MESSNLVPIQSLYLVRFAVLILLAIFKSISVSGVSLEANSVADSNAVFANSVFNIIQSGSTTENFVFSPFALTTALWLLSTGARGTTGEEIRTGLKLSQLPEHDVKVGLTDILNSFNAASSAGIQILLNNSLFIDEEFKLKESFVATARNIWKSNVQSLNFSQSAQAKTKIDEWVTTTSQSKLKSLFETEDLGEELTSVLVSLANVGGPWKKKFGRNSVRERPFFVGENERIRVDMMTLDDWFKHAVLPELESSAVFIPFQGDRLGLVILLPDHRTGIERVVDKLRGVSFANIIRKLKRKWVELSLPKFKIESTFDFARNGILTKLGIRTLLYRTADFNGISCQTGFHLSQLLHSSMIELNEEGMDGRPPTVTKINSLKNSSHRSVRFYVDHPFLMFVYDQLTRSILMIAQKIN